MSKDGYNINEPPVGNVRPAIPPKAPPAPPGRTNDLPLLPSTHKEYQNKIKELQAEIEQTYASALRKATGIINKSELDEETKKELIYLIWK